MPGERRYFLGIDSGRSSTRAVIGDQSGSVLGRAVAGPLNDLTSEAAEGSFISSARELLNGVMYDAGLPFGTELEGGSFGMSGCPADKFDLLARLAACKSSEMVPDAEVALEGAAAGGPGVVVIAGTGSMALARDASRNRARCGGWGYVFGDEGSAFDIARSALRKALAAEEGWGDATTLGRLFRAATGSSTVNASMHRFYEPDWPRDRIARLAVEVDCAAQRGDESARAVLSDAGNTLARLAARACQALPGIGPALNVYPSGGVFASRLVRDSFASRLRAVGLALARPAHDPAIGALLLAYRSVKLKVTIREL